MDYILKSILPTNNWFSLAISHILNDRIDSLWIYSTKWSFGVISFSNNFFELDSAHDQLPSLRHLLLYGYISSVILQFFRCYVVNTEETKCLSKTCLDVSIFSISRHQCSRHWSFDPKNILLFIAKSVCSFKPESPNYTNDEIGVLPFIANSHNFIWFLQCR